LFIKRMWGSIWLKPSVQLWCRLRRALEAEGGSQVAASAPYALF